VRGVSPLFGNPEKKAQKEAELTAARAETDRLLGLSPPALAAEVLPDAFGAGGPKVVAGTRGLNVFQVAMAVTDKNPRGTTYLKELVEPIREALQVLEHAELILRNTNQDQGARYTLTRLGQATLADGTVAEKLHAAG